VAGAYEFHMKEMLRAYRA